MSAWNIGENGEHQDEVFLQLLYARATRLRQIRRRQRILLYVSLMNKQISISTLKEELQNDSTGNKSAPECAKRDKIRGISLKVSPVVSW